MSKKGLGRGLQALLPTVEKVDKNDTDEKIIEILLSDIKLNKNQPRSTFDEEKLKELALSIKEHGVVQPVIVRPIETGKFELVAGERRWRACQMVGLARIPAIVRKLNQKETSEIALIENIQRENLNPIEEGAAYKTLMDEYGLTQEELSKRVGKSRPFIANTVRLLALPETVKKMVVQGTISAGHARSLLAISKSRDQEAVAQKIASKGLTVRQTEKEVKAFLTEKKAGSKASLKADPNVTDLEDKLKKKFSTRVYIKRGKKSGRIEIEYYGAEELQRLLEVLLGEEIC
ncbi:MAG: ParB/RepB/Spo0J family partition protein [Thermincola sp.]|nr:ParB/RepB/Spo0J family partition protein [Thermincola sp.]MDT3701953.1 ParB/RepB/Spo0J family partition protein [Thermincola sp.]